MPTVENQPATVPIPYQDGCCLCGKPSDNVVLREGEVEGRRCECGLVYAHPMPPADTIDSLADHHFESFYAAPARIKARWLASHCPPGRLLEVGCGMGHFLEAVRERGYQVTGMEPHARRSEHVRKTLGIKVEQAFLYQHKLPPGTFDVVYHCDLLSHFADPAGALRSMTRLLRPGGMLCLEVGTLGGISPRWYPWVNVGLKHHIWLYSYRALRKLFSSAGLDVVAERRFGLAPQVIIPQTLEAAYELGKSCFGKRSQPLADQAAGRETQDLVNDEPTPSRMSAQKERLNFFLRYYVGRISPPIGPQTYFFVLQPKKKKKKKKKEEEVV